MKCFKLFWFLSWVMISCSVIACYAEEDSCNVRTPGVYVQYSVTEQGENASVEAVFWVGDDPYGTNLELGACGDNISVNGVNLHESGTNPTRYVANVSAIGEYAFAFERPDEGTYTSMISSDGPLEIISPTGSAVSRDNDIEVQWNDFGTAQIELFLQSNCFESVSEIVTNDGAYTVPADDIRMHPYYCTQTCAAQLHLVRYFYGQLSPSLKGSIRGEIRDAVYFDSTPATGEVPYDPDTETDTQ